ncbi:MAG: acylphosphatase, partial [Chlorobiaceae bacterium]|nr:acylphosphatase [Chlorobiaceae bacterium]
MAGKTASGTLNSSVASIGGIRRRATVSGIVQGVGFRPFVYRLAIAIGLDGFVRNTASGVLLEVQGDQA